MIPVGVKPHFAMPLVRRSEASSYSRAANPSARSTTISSPAPVLRFAGRHAILSLNAEKLDYDASPEKLEAIAKMIRAEDPDLVVLQEVQAKYALTRLNEDHLGGVYDEILYAGKPGDMGYAMLSKPCLRPLYNKLHLDLSQPGAPNYSRGFFEAIYRTPSGDDLTVINVHLKSGWGGEERSQSTRIWEAQRLNERVSHLLGKGVRWVMVIGDLNINQANLLGYQVYGVLTGFNRGAPEQAVLYDSARLKDTMAPTHPNSGVRFDIALLSKALVPHLKEARVVGNGLDESYKEASDHLPIVNVLDFPDAPGEPAPPFSWRTLNPSAFGPPPPVPTWCELACVWPRIENKTSKVQVEPGLAKQVKGVATRKRLRESGN